MTTKREHVTVDLTKGDLSGILQKALEKHPECSRHALARVALAAGLALLTEQPEVLNKYASGFRVLKLIGT